MCVSLCVNMCSCVYVHLHVHVSMCASVHMYVYVRMLVCVVCVCTCVCVYGYIRMYMCIVYMCIVYMCVLICIIVCTHVTFPFHLLYGYYTVAIVVDLYFYRTIVQWQFISNNYI